MKTINELQNLSGKWALITGGAGHVGDAAAQTLLELGANVILLDRDSDNLAQAIDRLKSSRVFSVVCDLKDTASIDAVVMDIEAICPSGLNIIINNAAFVGTDKLTGWCVPFEQQSVDTWKACLDVNLTAPFYLVQQCMALLSKSAGDKSVINVSSIYGVVGPQMDMYAGTDMGNPAAYGASKAGLMQLTRWLASVLAPNVRVNNLVLGGIFRGQDEQFLAKYNQKVLLKRMATEQDVKGAIAYLASPMSAYLTGQSIMLDGGWTAI